MIDRENALEALGAEGEQDEPLRYLLRLVHEPAESELLASAEMVEERDLEKRVLESLNECGVAEQDQHEVLKHLAIVREKDHQTYRHIMRVALTSGQMVEAEQRGTLLMAGL